MRAVPFFSATFLFIAGVDIVRATTACGTPPEDVPTGPRYPGLPAAGTRVWDPALAIDIRCKKGNSAQCAEGDGVGPNDCTQGAYWHQWIPNARAKERRHLDRNSKIPQHGKLKKLANRAQGTSRRYTCDHVVELNMLKQVMEAPGGVCDQAHERYTTSTNANEKKKVLAALVSVRAISFKKTNLHFFDYAVESQKTLSVQNPAHLLTLDYYRMSELHDFINGAGPGSRSKNVAAQMDSDMAKHFKQGPQSVVAVWTEYANAVKAAYAIAVKKAQKVVARDTQCNANANSQHGGGGTRTLLSRNNLEAASRMIRRHLSDVAFTGGIESSLTIRAGARRSAPRSGPNAPKGPCCPKKNEVPKKVVNKQAAKTRPKPANRPRQPAARPKPRAPSANKRRVARPATRARRDVGKQSRPRRATPKRKPKVVPKATRRPRGKPRTRRRRR